MISRPRPKPPIAPDLFGEYDRHQARLAVQQAAADAAESARRAEAEARLAARAEWEARFERADWIAPWDCADGTPKGAVTSGWRCPDPECGRIEPNSYLLSINHGFDPGVPGLAPRDGMCTRRRYQLRRAELGITPQPYIDTSTEGASR